MACDPCVISVNVLTVPSNIVSVDATYIYNNVNIAVAVLNSQPAINIDATYIPTNINVAATASLQPIVSIDATYLPTSISVDALYSQPIISIQVENLYGLSAYEMAVSYGFVGTELEWLNSLGNNSGGSNLQAQINNKVDKIAGSGLIEDIEKARLSTIINYDDSFIIQTLGNKVDIEAGKGLSPEEFTLVEKNKLNSITEVFTTALKDEYDSSGDWIVTNGSDLLSHLTNNNNPHNITKTQIGLSDVDNVSDVNKPVSIEQQSALDLKSNISDVNNELDLKADITQISNIDNTSDINKPISTATQTVLDLKAFKDSPVFTGTFQVIGLSGTGTRMVVADASGNVSTQTIPSGGAVTTVAGRTGDIVLTKSDVGLSNVDNTTDLLKPISTATQTALDLKQNNLSGTGFIKANGTTISYDNTIYLSTTLASSTYELIISTKNTAFNKNFGIIAGTVSEGNHTHSFSSLEMIPTTLSGYGIIDAYPLDGNPSNFITNIPAQSWSLITSKPTTVAGYGITDFNSLGDARWSILSHTHTFASLTSIPTTLSGYGITDAYPLSGNPSGFLTTIPSQTWVSITGKPSFATVATSGSYTDLANNPTTISGYGITDFNSLGDARWSGLNHTQAFSTITSKPTTLSGYGITDGITSTDVSTTYAPIQSPTFNGDVNATQFIGGGAGLTDLTKSQVGLTNVDNTSDTNKPISTATQTALNLKFNTSDFNSTGDARYSLLAHTHTFTSLTSKPITLAGYGITDAYPLSGNPSGFLTSTPVTSVSGKTGDVSINQTDVGLSNVDNTSDINKPVSIATTTQLNLKADKTSINNIDNTSDANKPISTLQQNALYTKVDKVSGKGLSPEEYTTVEKQALALTISRNQIMSINSIGI